MSPLASSTIGPNWVVNEGRLKCLAPNLEMELLPTVLEDP